MDSGDTNVLIYFFSNPKRRCWTKGLWYDRPFCWVCIFLKFIGQFTKHGLNVGVGGRDEDSFLEEENEKLGEAVRLARDNNNNRKLPRMSPHTFQSRVHTWPSVFAGTAMWQVGTSRELAGVTHLEHEGMRKMIEGKKNGMQLPTPSLLFYLPKIGSCYESFARNKDKNHFLWMGWRRNTIRMKSDTYIPLNA